MSEAHEITLNVKRIIYKRWTIFMKIKLTSREYSGRLARERGIPIATPDHPIYKEGPTYIVLNDLLKPTSANKSDKRAKDEESDQQQK